MKDLDWKVSERTDISDLDELSQFEYNESIGNNLKRELNPLDIQNQMIDGQGSYKGDINVNFDFPVDGVVKWRDVTGTDQESARTETSLHPLLKRFLDGEGPRAIYIGRREDDFEIELFEDVEVEETFRNGCTKTHDVRGVYNQPYEIPLIADVLSDANFHFYGHSRFGGGILVGGTPFYSTVFGLRDILEERLKISDQFEDSMEGIMATLPCFDRKKGEKDFEYMDIYVKRNPSG
ncbi:hypothetical protein CMI42_03160 [Candidatus Pacearchaeota archaeon]|nr:hypothetical protein [Candidatus Pacearchaeota archaeon]